MARQMARLHPNPVCATPVCARGHGGPRRASRRGRLRQRGVRAATNRSDGANPLGDRRRSRHDGSGWDRHAHADPRTDTRPCAGRSGSGRQLGSDGPGNRANRYDPVQLVQRRESPARFSSIKSCFDRSALRTAFVSNPRYVRMAEPPAHSGGSLQMDARGVNSTPG